MYRGTTNQLAKVWEKPGVTQISEIKAGTTVRGYPPRADGYVQIVSPRIGYTKKIWLTGYVEEVIVTPPPPPAELPGTLYISTVPDHSDEKIYKVVV